MCGVRLDLKEEEILEALHEQVKYVKRFKCKHREHNVMRDSSTVPLHFIKSELPAEIKIGYLNFKTKEDIPKPTRFFKCNRFGHVASHCKGKERCSKCDEEHSWTTCTAIENKCPNCRGNHSANDRSCPRYKCEEKVLKI